MLYILEEAHMTRGMGSYMLAVEAENEKEAERMANEFVKNDWRVLNLPIPFFNLP